MDLLRLLLEWILGDKGRTEALTHLVEGGFFAAIGRMDMLLSSCVKHEQQKAWKLYMLFLNLFHSKVLLTLYLGLNYTHLQKLIVYNAFQLQV